MNRVKVLRIIARLNIGGPAIHTILLTAGLNNERFESLLVTGVEGKREGNMLDLAAAKGVEPIVIRELRRNVDPKDGLIALFKLYRLIRCVRIVVQEGEIRILPAEEDWEKVLDELAGCLGEEAAQNYDFKLKLGGLPHTCSQIEGGGRMTRLQAVRAIYKDGALVFADPELVPKDGAEVVVTFLEERGRDVATEVDPIRALRGRGKGEGLVEKLLQSRREDQERDEQSRERLRA